MIQQSATLIIMVFFLLTFISNFTFYIYFEPGHCCPFLQHLLIMHQTCIFSWASCLEPYQIQPSPLKDIMGACSDTSQYGLIHKKPMRSKRLMYRSTLNKVLNFIKTMAIMHFREYIVLLLGC